MPHYHNDNHPGYCVCGQPWPCKDANPESVEARLARIERCLASINKIDGRVLAYIPQEDYNFLAKVKIP